MKLSKKLGLAASLAGALFLAACGDDGSSGKPAPEKDGTASVPTYDDLAHCTKSHYGEIVFVEEESAYFECTSEDWAEVDESKLDSLLAAASSSSEADEDKPKSSSSLKADSTETADVEKVEVDSITVKGFAQKGPFASGTAVTVYGLDSLLEKTKTKFTGKVSGDSGAFKVEKIVLPSQYALVEVSGYYQNEVTGKKTSGSKTTLSALVDLSEGKTVKANVNLFTDLEYARAKHLVLKEKFNVPAAKKRATKELLAVFGGKGDDDLTATALSLSDTTSAGKALLFASILLQGELSASKFGILLGGIEEFFGSTGGLDSAEATAAFADWASKVDSTDNFAAIRENVKSMKLVAAVPDFESALYAFWTKEYGLGACTDSLESTIEKNSNKKSENYGAGYACTARRWHKATALDTELGLCTGKMEGQFKEYKGGKTAEYYVCKVGSWNKITETQFELKECTEDRDNEYVMTKDSSYFVCSDKQWKELDADGFELKDCNKDRDQKIFKTKRENYYKCVSGEWEKTDKLSYELQDAGACTEKNNLDSYETESFGIYVCDNKEWRETSSLEKEIGICGDKDNSDSTFKQNGTHYYVCLNKNWAETDSISFDVKALCGEANMDKRKKSGENNYYICQNSEGKWTWNSIDLIIYELGLCQKSKNDSTMGKTSDNRYWHCANNKWETISDTIYTTKKFCNAANDSTFANGYACIFTASKYRWRAQTPAEKANNIFCTTSNSNPYSIMNGYVCESSGWRDATAAEKATNQICNSNIVYDVINRYACVPSLIRTNYGYQINYDHVSYYWKTANDAEIATGQVCYSGAPYKINGYRCSGSGTWIEHSWVALTELEKALDSVCVGGKKNVIYKGYVCADDDWRQATTSEIELNKACNEVLYIENDASIYKCQASTHTWNQEAIPSFTNTSDGYTYRYIHIGDYDYMIDNVKNHHDNDSASNWWCYENKWENCEKYGMLYTWTAVLGIPQTYLDANYTGSLTEIQGACPEGWHVPTKAEMTAINNSSNKSLKNIINKDVGSYDPAQSPVWNKTASYWVADEYADVANVAWGYGILFDFVNKNKRQGLYLRCIKNR